MLVDKHEKFITRSRLRLRSRGPLQQHSAAHGHAPDRTHGCIQQHEGLRRYLAELPGGAANGGQQLPASHLEKVTPGNARACRHQARQRAQQRPGEQGGNRNQQGCIERQCPGKDDPDEQCERARHHQRAAQVVSHLPDAQCVNTVATGVPHQRYQLPVAARPAMVAGRRHPCMVRRVFDQRHVADKAAARNAALQQIVAEHGFLRQAAVQHGMHCLDMQQSLAAEAAGAKQVLVDVGDAAAVGVDAALAGKQPVVGRVLRRVGQRRHDPRLQNAVAADDAAQGRIDLWCIQRVGRYGHQFAQCAGRQAGIAVQRDHITDTVRQPRRCCQRHEALHAAGGKQAQQLLQLAALALPAQPALLGFAPAARPVDQQEAWWRTSSYWIVCIERRQLGQRILYQARIAGQRVTRRVDPVCQQCELRFIFAVGQPVKFKLPNQFPAGRRGAQQRGNDDQNPVFRRNAIRKAEAGQWLHLERLGNQTVHKG